MSVPAAPAVSSEAPASPSPAGEASAASPDVIRKTINRTDNKYIKDPAGARYYQGGINFKAKLLGQIDVESAAKDEECREALVKLKAQVKISGQHKQRLLVNVDINGLRIAEEATGAVLHTHEVGRISFLARDPSDTRAFGYVYGEGQGKHKFFGFKTEKAADNLILTIRDLFQFVFELKRKKESGTPTAASATTPAVTEANVANPVVTAANSQLAVPEPIATVPATPVATLVPPAAVPTVPATPTVNLVPPAAIPTVPANPVAPAAIPTVPATPVVAAEPVSANLITTDLDDLSLVDTSSVASPTAGTVSSDPFGDVPLSASDPFGEITSAPPLGEVPQSSRSTPDPDKYAALSSDVMNLFGGSATPPQNNTTGSVFSSQTATGLSNQSGSVFSQQSNNNPSGSIFSQQNNTNQSASVFSQSNVNNQSSLLSQQGANFTQPQSSIAPSASAFSSSGALGSPANSRTASPLPNAGSFGANLGSLGTNTFGATSSLAQPVSTSSNTFSGAQPAFSTQQPGLAASQQVMFGGQSNAFGTQQQGFGQQPMQVQGMPQQAFQQSQNIQQVQGMPQAQSMQQVQGIQGQMLQGQMTQQLMQQPMQQQGFQQVGVVQQQFQGNQPAMGNPQQAGLGSQAQFAALGGSVQQSSFPPQQQMGFNSMQQQPAQNTMVMQQAASSTAAQQTQGASQAGAVSDPFAIFN